MRIYNHPILEFKRGKEIVFEFNGRKITAYEGETIAAALHANGVFTLSKSIHHNRPRGFFCGIGKCSSCLMNVDGIPNVKTCLVLAEDGMKVETQTDRGRVPAKDDLEGKETVLEADVAVVGGGPAGLCAAIEASRAGAKVVLFDENPVLGGQLVKQTHMFFGSEYHYAGTRGVEIGNILKKHIAELESRGNVIIKTQTSVTGFYRAELNIPPEKGGLYRENYHLLSAFNMEEFIRVYAKRVIIATGACENMLPFPNNDLPGVYGAGGVQTLMNVYGVKPGKKVLMVGAGNVGLIVSYQLLQAGVEVAALVEAAPAVGGYMVHASKIARLGVPIYTSHTIKRAHGKEKVTGATIVQLDSCWNEVPGTEKEIECDTICLAVGLNPSAELLHQAGCRVGYCPELGGWVPLHNKFKETTVSGVYVAGDVSGIEEASSAMMGGRIAGITAALTLGFGEPVKAKKMLDEYFHQLDSLRKGPFGERVCKGIEKIEVEFEKQCPAADSTKVSHLDKKDYGTEQKPYPVSQASQYQPTCQPCEFIKRGYLSQEEIKEYIPDEKRLSKGPVAIIECVQNIPCNPCSTCCPKGAIVIKDITDKPRIDPEKCTGCGICVYSCPGLAIFVVDMSENAGKDKAIVKIPFEFTPLPEKGETLQCTDRSGNVICEGKVIGALLTKKMHNTAVISLEVPKEKAMVVRGIRLDFSRINAYQSTKTAGSANEKKADKNSDDKEVS
ncbi:MAG: FAD-dependent oxidoreductase, partial [Thermoplasmata archaeon]